jgi:uncharacterized membrane protein
LRFKKQKMTQLIVAFFNNESRAVAAVKKLHDLESYGIITVYDKIIIHKKTDGGYEVVAEDVSGEYSILAGLVRGGLPGAFAGPAGFIAGVFAGTAAGTLPEINRYNFTADFIAAIEEKMAADNISVIAEMDALTDAFIGVYITPFDAIVVKTDIDFMGNSCFSNEMQENQKAIEAAAMDLKKGKNRQVIQANLRELKTMRKSIFAVFEAGDDTGLETAGNDTALFV